MEQKLTEDQRDARSLIIVTVSALLFFPAMSLLFKAVSLLQYILLGYVQ